MRGREEGQGWQEGAGAWGWRRVVGPGRRGMRVTRVER